MSLKEQEKPLNERLFRSSVFTLNCMNIKVTLDARKLGDGGIGTYIQNLVDGFLELNSDISGFHELGVDLSLIVSPDEAFGVDAKGISQDIKRWRESGCLLYTSPSPRDLSTSRMPSSA